MKKLQCILGHPFIKLKDLEKSTLENDKENVTIYRCKDCGQVVFSRVNFVKAVFKSPDTVKDNFETKVREYENWSINNTLHSISLLAINSEKGCIHLVSDKKITDIEQLGVINLLEHSYKALKGLDVYYTVYHSTYNPKTDIIKGENGVGLTKDASKKFEKYVNFPKEEIEDILTIEFQVVKRYEKSTLWKLKNKRKCMYLDNY